MKFSIGPPAAGLGPSSTAARGSVRDAFAKGESGAMERAVAELSDLIYYLES